MYVGPYKKCHYYFETIIYLTVGKFAHHPSSRTARGTAATPTNKSATAKDTRKQKVGSRKESKAQTQTALKTSTLPRQQAVATSTSTIV